MDTTTLSTLIDAIYAAGMGTHSWQAVATDVAKAFGEQSGVLYQFNARLRQSQILGSTPMDMSMIAKYEQYYGSIDTLHWRVIREPTLEANATHNLIRDADFQRSEYYNDYFRHLDLFYAMGSVVRRKDDRTTVFGVQRSKRRGHFDAREFKRMEILSRHIDRSLEIAERLQHAARPSFDSADTGFVLLDMSGKAVFATRSVGRLLQMAGIGFEAGRLSAPAAIGDRLGALVQSLTQGTNAGKAVGNHLDIDLPGGQQLRLLGINQTTALGMAGIDHLACLVVELRATPEDLTAILRRRYGLTATEAALATALAEARTLRAISESRGVSINTLRVQLQAIFAKTGCHRQSELVRLVLDLKRG